MLKNRPASDYLASSAAELMPERYVKFQFAMCSGAGVIAKKTNLISRQAVQSYVKQDVSKLSRVSMSLPISLTTKYPVLLVTALSFLQMTRWP